jgi:osmotically-inducible protein OsmY
MRYLLLLLLLLASGCVSSAFSGANVVYRHKYLQDDVSNYAIRIGSWNTLRKQFPQELLKPIHLTVFHKVVLITGQVPNQEARAQIEQALKCVPKIARIYNATTIEPPATTGEQVQDSWLTTKVKSKIIASDQLYADKIIVVTEKRIVYLAGIITQQEADCAIALAKSTDGVKQVVTIFFFMTMPEI